MPILRNFDAHFAETTSTKCPCFRRIGIWQNGIRQKGHIPTKNVRYHVLSVVSHKQVHECAASKVVCAMASGRYLTFSGRGSTFDHSRLARRMVNFDAPALPTAEQGVVGSSSYPVPT